MNGHPFFQKIGVFSGDFHFKGPAGFLLAVQQGAFVAVMDDGTSIHENQGIAHFPQFGENVGADEQGFPPGLEQMHQVLEFHARLGVQTGGGFVQNEELGIADQGARQAQALGLPLGKLVDEPRLQLSQLREVQHFVHGGEQAAARNIVCPGEEIQIFPDAGVFVGVEVVRHPADQGAHLMGMVHGVDAVDQDASGVGEFQRGEHAHGGRLSGSVGADQADHLSFPDLEGDAADGFNLVKGFGQSGNFKQNGLCHGCWGRGWFPAAGPETVMRVFSHLMESRVGMGPNSPSADIISA